MTEYITEEDEDEVEFGDSRNFYVLEYLQDRKYTQKVTAKSPQEAIRRAQAGKGVQLTKEELLEVWGE